jgi:hypothetical protein
MADNPSRYDPRATDDFARKYSDTKNLVCTHEVLALLNGVLPQNVDPENEKVRETVTNCRKAFGMVD